MIRYTDHNTRPVTRKILLTGKPADIKQDEVKSIVDLFIKESQ